MSPAASATAPHLDLTSLQLFVAACEVGSIGQAAEREGIVASAVSKRLADLESALGSPLLERHARGVRPTPAGQALLHHARKLLFGLQALHGELAEFAEGVRGHVRVHASLSAIVQFLPEDLGSFSQAQPQIKIDLQEQLSGEVLRAVEAGATDLGIAHVEGRQSGLQTLPYHRDRLLLVTPAGHPLSQRGALALADTLAADHVGLRAGSSIALALQRAATRAGQPLRLRIAVTSLDAMCRMIANGLGVGVMPQRAYALLSRGSAALAAVPLTDAWAERQLSLLARDFDSLPPSARLLVDHLLQCAGSTPPARVERRAASA